MSARIAPPGPSFLREMQVPLQARPGAPGRVVWLGMTRPTTTDDGWWLAIVYAHDEEGVVRALDFAPRAGPPPTPPLIALGPSVAGALSGLVAEEAGRQAIRLRLPEGEPGAHDWDRPMAVQVAIRWEPMRAATMQPAELAREVLAAFRRALLSAGSPGVRVAADG